MQLKRFLAIFKARNHEFWRDRASLSWNLAFPLLLIFGFTFIFSGDGKSELKIGVVAQSLPKTLESIKYTDFILYQPNTYQKDEILKKVSHHQIDLLLDPASQFYWVNSTSPKGYLAEQLVVAKFPKAQSQTIEGRAINYVDWVIPGILGMNIMFSCLFGVGYVIVRYRKSGVLKRLKATPITSFEFVAAQIASRFIIVVTISSVIFLATWFLIDFAVLGSLLTLLIILCLGTLSLIALGLLIAARSSSEELTGGLLNFASWPMMFLSGVWFSLEGAPKTIVIMADFLPLTHLVQAARKVMTEGATLYEVQYHILLLIIMSVIFFIGAGVSFSWGKNR